MLRLLFVLTLSLLFARASFANEFIVMADDAGASDNFGKSVAVWGDYAIIGSPYDDDLGTNAGAAYIFHWTGSDWVQQKKLTASDGEANDNFGSAVAIYGDYAIVGAFAEDDSGGGAGAAYIFYRNTGGTDNWGQQAKIIGSDTESGDWFGISVALYGTYAVVGAEKDDDGGTDAGAAYLFQRSGTSWNQKAKLVASDPADYDHFGIAVSMDGDYIVVGARDKLYDNSTTYAGAAYVFVPSGRDWVQDAKLTAPNPQTQAYFGGSVDVSGNTVVIGEADRDTSATNAGAAYVFIYSREQWSHQATLAASGPQEGARFGKSVAISGDSIIVGSYLYDKRGLTDAGAAYLFVRNSGSWSQTEQIFASDAEAEDDFGYSVDINNPHYICGAFQADSPQWTNAGAAYIFSPVTSAIENPEVKRVDISGFALYENYPNPFNPSTTIRLAVPVEGSKQRIQLNIYNMLGQKVAEVFEGRLKAGVHEMRWDASNMPSGQYIVLLQAGNFSVSKRITLVK